MAGKKAVQAPLIPLTEEELKEAPRKLANLIDELETTFGGLLCARELF